MEGKARKGLLGLWLLMAMVLGWAGLVHAETDVTAKIQVVKGTLAYDRLNKQSYLNVSIKNISQEMLLPPIKVVIDSVLPSTVVVANADGVTAEGKPFFNYTTENGLFPPGATIGGKAWKFSNPSAARFSYTIQVVGSIPDAVATVGPEGGTLIVTDPNSALIGLTVTIPPNALNYEEYITVKVVTENLPDDFHYATTVMDFSSNSNSFNENIQIILPYMDGDNDGIVDGTDIPENEIMIVYYDKSISKWIEIPIKNLDTVNNVVTYEVNHFTIHAAVKKQSFEDSEAPKLISFTYSTNTVDVSNGAAKIDFTLKATDNLSGIKQVLVYAHSESGQYYAYKYAPLTSGSIWDGVFKGTITIPQYTPAGKWKFSYIYIYENVGNNNYITTGQDYGFQVTSNQEDNEAPKLISFTYSTNTVDVSNGAAKIDFTLKATDNLSGIKQVLVYAHSESGQYYAYTYAYLKEGTNKDGVYKGTITIPQSTPAGKWKFYYIYIYENVGNNYSWSQDIASGQDYGFQVTSNQEDNEAPKLISFTYSPNTVSVTNGAAKIDFTLKATDNLSGIKQVYVNAYSESGQYFVVNAYAYLKEGTNKDGVYKGTITIPQYTPAGKWKFSAIYIYDNVGNKYYWSQNIASGHDYEFAVTGATDINQQLFNMLLSKARVGDILLFSNCPEGTEPLNCTSSVVWGFDGLLGYGYFQHAALIYQKGSNNLTILQARSPSDGVGTDIQDSKTFSNKWKSVQLLRVKNFSDTDAEWVANHAYSRWNGTEYDIAVMGPSYSIIMSSAFNNKVYCSELIWDAYNEHGVALNDNSYYPYGVFTPDNILQSGNVEIVMGYAPL